MEQFLERVLERLMEHLLEQLSEQILVEQIVAAPQWVLEQVIKQVVEFREAKERLDPCAQAKKVWRLTHAYVRLLEGVFYCALLSYAIW